MPHIETAISAISREDNEEVAYYSPDQRQDMFSMFPEPEPLTEEDLIAWEKQMRESMTPEDWAKWGIREGESDLEHVRRCSAQLYPTHESMYDDHHDDI